jgi:CRP/FNR family transcriptional regulator, cyclic AMP receptor protein
MAVADNRMSTILQSSQPFENTGRSMNSQGLFYSLPKEVKDQLSVSARLRKFVPGQLIQHRGDPSDGFWVIKKGQVKLGHYDQDGNMQVLVILGSGDSFGELSCFGRFPRVVDAEAVGHLEMQWFLESALTELLATSHEIVRDLLAALSRQLQESLYALVELRKDTASKRLCRSLLALSKGKSSPTKLVIGQLELAELVGVSRMSIAKTLKALEGAGLIERGYREITILDRAGLQSWLSV